MTPFGQFLHKHAISVIDAAEALEVDRQTIYGWQSGEITPSLAKAIYINTWASNIAGTVAAVPPDSWGPYVRKKPRKARSDRGVPRSPALARGRAKGRA